MKKSELIILIKEILDTVSPIDEPAVFSKNRKVNVSKFELNGYKRWIANKKKQNINDYNRLKHD